MKHVLFKVNNRVIGNAQIKDADVVTVEYEAIVEDSHVAVRESCERWRGSLLINCPTDYLHSPECSKVADLLREKTP